MAPYGQKSVDEPRYAIWQSDGHPIVTSSDAGWPVRRGFIKITVIEPPPGPASWYIGAAVLFRLHEWEFKLGAVQPYAAVANWTDILTFSKCTKCLRGFRIAQGFSRLVQLWRLKLLLGFTDEEPR